MRGIGKQRDEQEGVGRVKKWLQRAAIGGAANSGTDIATVGGRLQGQQVVGDTCLPAVVSLLQQCG